MTLVEFLGLGLVVTAVIGVSLQLEHLLCSLLLLEVIPLGLYCLTVGLDSFLCLFLLALSACEAAVGLAVLVASARAVGSDFLDSLSVSKA
uniref:NADH-ubiquinone oxidoreductase chain 4L n=1 Tax=Laternula elliptica TaxID=228457 RepID=U5TUJ0_LATEL|nr:NADH dehydrogenase subunit 4L [Laternula elliptica]AGZ13055.1 NADH dehydrogenase subunit 4L [Laternula elliptica]AQZ26142.1 NADH dehydrogenase subunit 4L [Laternula elliptica]